MVLVQLHCFEESRFFFLMPPDHIQLFPENVCGPKVFLGNGS